MSQKSISAVSNIILSVHGASSLSAIPGRTQNLGDPIVYIAGEGSKFAYHENPSRSLHRGSSRFLSPTTGHIQLHKIPLALFQVLRT